MLMRRNGLLVCVLAVFGWSLFAADPAEAARRDGLSNSELIEDKDDVFTYPQLSVEYDNMVSFEYGGSIAQGNALGLFGAENYAVGFALHRGTMFEMRGLNAPITRGTSQTGGSQLEDGNAGPSPLQYDLVPSRSYPYPSIDGQAASRPQSPVNGRFGSYQQNHTVVDLIGGYDLGIGSLGARLSLGVGGAKFSGSDSELTNEGQSYFLFRGGYSGDIDGFSLDTSLSFVTNGGDNKDLSSGDDVTSASVTGFAIEGRAKNDFSDEFALGALLDLGYTSLSENNETSDPTSLEVGSNFMVQAGAGPVFTVGGDDEGESDEEVARYAQFGAEDDEEETGDEESAPEPESDEDETASDATSPASASETAGTSDQRPARRPAPARRRPAEQKDPFEQSAEIATYGVVGFSSVGGDPSDEAEDDSYTMTSLTLPGVHLAGEFHVLRWLYFRSGAQYFFHHFETRFDDGDGTNAGGGDNSAFGWSAGMGVEVGDFRFDGAFNRGFLRGGPNFISGYSGGLFATASAQYRW
jgi:hypothetical protein